MSRRRRGRPVHGVVLLDKPGGLSSNQALQKVRRLFDAQKAGHTGSLDPLATGMLPVCLGEASKTAGYMLDADKTYLASLRLGESTTTGDAEGEVVERQAVPDLDEADIRAALQAFVGEISQVPPMYSALKVDGRPLYERARRGETIERQARQIRIHRLELLGWDTPDLSFEVHCSKGTYVRTLAEDIARELGCCGHLAHLRRTRVGVFDPAALVTLERLEQDGAAGCLERHLLPVDAGLSDWPSVEIEAAQAVRFRHGNTVEVGLGPSRGIRVFDCAGQLLGLGRVDGAGVLKPDRVFQIESEIEPAH